MKLAILGDTHFGARGDSQDFHNFFEKFYMNTFFPYLKENNIDTVFQLGDLFDRRKYINFNSLYRCRQYFFDLIQEYDIDFYTLLGNHDISYKNTLKVNSSELLLKEYKNITVYSDYAQVEFDGLKIDVIPWLCKENDKQMFEKMKASDSQFCFGHFDIDGFEMYRGNVCLGGIPKEKFQKYDTVLTGHFHHRSTNGNITYVGTPCEMMWSDYNDVKGFHILDTETREMEFVANPYQMFYRIKYDDSQTDFDFWKKYDYPKTKDSYVKIVVLNKQNPYLFDSVLDNFYKAEVADLSIVEDFSDMNFGVDKDIINQAEDTMTILSKYIDDLPLNVEPEKLKNIMKELYVEALNEERV